MKRNLTLTVIFCALVVLTSLGAVDKGKPNLVLTESTFDAGVVYRTGAKLEHVFVIKNTGTSNLEIISATPG
jgi:hypothetical protein